LPDNVQTAAIQVFTALLPVSVVAVAVGPKSCGRIRKHARSADFGAQQAARGQGVVSDLLGSQTDPGSAGQQPVLRITFPQLPVELGRLTVSSRGDNQALHR